MMSHGDPHDDVAELLEIPLAIQHLRSLHAQIPAPPLQAYLQSLRVGKMLSEECLIEGIYVFTRIANLSPVEREGVYGSQFFGLHYNSDLKALWNADSPHKTNLQQVSWLCPPSWACHIEDGRASLHFLGKDLSAGLDALLQGPTVIDCGMFCQLSLWFGIRYLLGDIVFNQLFGQEPFAITQLLYEPITDPSKPGLGNPLYVFFDAISDKAEVQKAPIGVEYITNHKFYAYKHPGGNYIGENCLRIRNAYTLFDARLETKPRSKLEVEQFLLEVLNAPPDEHDEEKLSWYQSQSPGRRFQSLGLTFEDLLGMADMLKTQQYTWDDFCTSRAQAVQPAASFSYEKLVTWVRGMPVQEEKENAQLLDMMSYKSVAVYSADYVALVRSKEQDGCAADELLEVHQSLHHAFDSSHHVVEKRKNAEVEEQRKKPRCRF